MSDCDFVTFERLAQYEVDQQQRVAAVSKEFNDLTDKKKLSESQLSSILVDLAEVCTQQSKISRISIEKFQRFDLHSGRWIYFTKHLEDKSHESVFDYLLHSFGDEAIVRTTSRFNAKISPGFLVMR